MNDPTFNYVRTHRQRYALTDDELAFLLNQRHHSAITHLEAGTRTPNLEGALALQVLFRLQPKHLFPGYFEAVEERVMARVADLLEQLEDRTDSRSAAKREFLEGVARADSDDGI